jgi:hypothetical protein
VRGASRSGVPANVWNRYPGTIRKNIHGAEDVRRASPKIVWDRYPCTTGIFRGRSRVMRHEMAWWIDQQVGFITVRLGQAVLDS